MAYYSRTIQEEELKNKVRETQPYCHSTDAGPRGK